MLLSKYNLKNINSPSVQLPDERLFELPEKVLQFGTGVLLRGLPDYFIDKANKQGLFNGRIVVVKSTGTGDSSAFDKQDSLYTICVRGIMNGQPEEANIVCAAISRILSAKQEWNKVLECAHNPQMQVIISNTTEVGITLVHDDILRYPPVSFPGKVLAFLYERYKAFAGSRQCGMVIIPTELITDNGTKLESIVTELAYLNGLDEAFIDWLENCNHFCNTLVDRIVPGKPDEKQKNDIENSIGYTDELLIMSEAYRLWAIEGNDEVADILTFAKADKGVVIAGDINLFRELKLRLLNGTHTLSSGLAFLAGCHTVQQAMEEPQTAAFISGLMKDEIARAIPGKVDPVVAAAFADDVLDRFRNPQIAHQWLSITMQYTSKMKMRVVPVLQQYYSLFNRVPEHIALGFAAFLVFMKAVKEENGNYFGKTAGEFYPIRDDQAWYFYDKWQSLQPAFIPQAVLQDVNLWGYDLSRLPGFADAVKEKMEEILEHGMATVLLPARSSKLTA
ncbi:MAG: tagaturonate reductase [Ferruginibacter sp.]